MGTSARVAPVGADQGLPRTDQCSQKTGWMNCALFNPR
jgi:hypothetical protein